MLYPLHTHTSLTSPSDITFFTTPPRPPLRPLPTVVLSNGTLVKDGDTLRLRVYDREDVMKMAEGEGKVSELRGL